jgi:hypothetical protein
MRKTITAVTCLAAGARGPEQVGADLALLERGRCRRDDRQAELETLQQRSKDKNFVPKLRI